MNKINGQTIITILKQILISHKNRNRTKIKHENIYNVTKSNKHRVRTEVLLRKIQKMHFSPENESKN
jgi:hypothetical protein